MGKIAIVGFHNLHLMQFLYKYTEILDSYNIEYDVLYWERDDVQYPIKFKGRPIKYSYMTSNYMPKWKKIVGYLKCRSFFIKKIKENKYEKIILLTTQTAIALSPLVLTKYKKKFIFDFRDLTMEKNSIYRTIEMKLIQESSFVAISSPGFINRLNKEHKYVISHNCRNLMLNTKFLDIDKNKPLKITFWGMIRQEEFQRKICDAFGNDDRVEVSYHGEGCTNHLSQYCKEKQYKNIKFTGRYYPENIPNFLQETDVLLNMYENEGKQEYALTVKLYDAVRYQIPMLITKDSYMEKYLKEYCFAMAVDLKNIDIEKIARWYLHLDEKMLQEDFNRFVEKVKKDDKVFENELIKFVETK